MHCYPQSRRYWPRSKRTHARNTRHLVRLALASAVDYDALDLGGAAC